MEIFLDNCSTTKPDEKVISEMTRVMKRCFGNPSSLHGMGSLALEEINKSRYQVASLLAVPSDTIYFTSGASESNNIAILGSLINKTGHIVTTTIEHSSVLNPIQYLEKKGFNVTYVSPSEKSHTIEADDVIAAIRKDTVFVSVMTVNNETGDILPLEKIVKGIKQKNKSILIHTDATQSYGKIPFPTYKIPVDFLSASAHKIHGPKGIGILYARDRNTISPLTFGGRQEGGLIPGTENTEAICGMAIASSLAQREMKERERYVTSLKEYLKNKLNSIRAVHFNESFICSPYVLNFSISNVDSSDFVDYCSINNIFVSSGSACSKGAASYVIKECKYGEDRAKSAIRVGLSHTNTINEIDVFLEILEQYITSSSVAF